MRKSRFTVGQISRVLMRDEEGLPMAELYRQLEISDHTLRRWTTRDTDARSLEFGDPWQVQVWENEGGSCG